MDTKSVATTAPGANPWEVSPITVKLPTFYTSDPLSWFQRTEAQFGLRGISADETKFWHVLASLDVDTLAHMSCVIAQVKSGEKYTTLKSFLIKCYSLTSWERADRVLATTHLGDRRPSHLASHLPTTLGEFPPDILLHQVFMHCLPTYVQDALAGMDITDLKTLADRTDEIMACPCLQGPSVCNASLDLPEPADLQGDLPDVYRVYRQDTRRPTSQRQQPSGWERICFFHRRFSLAACQCQSPCYWHLESSSLAPRRQ